MNPAVWADVKPRIVNAASWLGIATELPNEYMDKPGTPSYWLSVMVGSDSSERIELGINCWEELGTVWLHLMIPVGYGIDTGLSHIETLCAAFRVPETSVVGLSYREQSVDPIGPDDGVYARLTATVHYRFTFIAWDSPEAPATANVHGGADVDADGVIA